MPVVTEPPPTRPEPHAPRRDADAQALIKEARRRQRRRQALIALGLVAVAAAAAIAVKGLSGGGAGSRRAVNRPGDGFRATVTTPFAVGAARLPVVFRSGKVVNTKPWGGVVIARPAAQRCTRVALPLASVVVFSGRRYAYEVGGSRMIAVGVVGRGEPHRFVPHFRAWGWPQTFSISPVWVDGRLGLLESNAPRLHLGGRTISLYIPPSAQFGGILAAAHGRIAYDVSWQNEWGTAVVKTAIFVYANGVTKLVRQVRQSPAQPAVAGEESWSPDGSRIAFLERGDLWTMRADGSHPRRLTSTPTIAKFGPLLWSTDSKTIVFDVVQHKGWNIYAIRASGGEPMQLTHSTFTRPLVWLGRKALAVASVNSPDGGDGSSGSLGVLDVASGAVRVICTLPSMQFTGATALR
jgi:hypothetical protein